MKGQPARTALTRLLENPNRMTGTVLSLPTNPRTTVGLNPHQRGYVVSYQGPSTKCPGCSHSNWHIGLSTAECAFCATALPLVLSRAA
jgi:hypothetical protein